MLDSINWDAIGAVAEAIGGIGVILTLGYLSLQIRGSNRVAHAQSRQAMSEFAMGFARFRAEHADRVARITSDDELSAGDKEFLYWNHMQMMTYGEAYFRQFELGLMPKNHWEGFSHWIDDYTRSPGFAEFWKTDRTSFSEDFSEWVDKKLG